MLWIAAVLILSCRQMSVPPNKRACPEIQPLAGLSLVTTQPSSKKVLKIFIRNKELIHCRKKKNSRRKEKNFDSLFLWISSFVLYCSSGKKGYFYPPFPFSTVFYPQSFCRTASYPRFAFSQPFLYNRNITEWKEACRIGPQI